MPRVGGGEPELIPENDTLARIGTSCFQQLLENNVRKLSPEKWELIVSAFVALFRTTTAGQLFDPVLHAEVEPTGEMDEGDGEFWAVCRILAPHRRLPRCDLSNDPTDARCISQFPCREPTFCLPLIPAAPFQKFVAPAPLEQAAGTPSLPAALSYVEQRRIFKQIIVKCVLQLLLIETTHELLQNDEVYNTIPAEHLLRFMGVLDDSWRFARKFNADRDLRMKLWKVGTLWFG